MNSCKISMVWWR